MKKRGKRIKYDARLPITIRFSAAQEVELQIEPHVCLDRIMRGIGDGDDIATIATRIEWGLGLVAITGATGTEALGRASDGLASVIARQASSGVVGAAGGEFRAIGEGLVLTDDLQKMATRRDSRDALLIAMKKTKARMQALAMEGRK